MDPKIAVTQYGKLMTTAEKTEVLLYPTVYYVGQNVGPNRVNIVQQLHPNGIHDNEDAYYLAIQNDHVAFRFEILSCAGVGECGQVLKAFDHKYENYIALKIIRRVPVYVDLAESEARITALLACRDPGIVRLLGNFTFRGHPCLVFELLGDNLSQLMQARHFRGFPSEVVRAIAKELLQCLSSLYDHHVIHADIKPENILFDCFGGLGYSEEPENTVRRVPSISLAALSAVRRTSLEYPAVFQSSTARARSDDSGFIDQSSGMCFSRSRGSPTKLSIDDRSDQRLLTPVKDNINIVKTSIDAKGQLPHVKLIDFGCSTVEGSYHRPYIQSRYYRAPEVILGLEYGTEIDMWSLACCLAELLTGRSLLPGEDEFDQLSCIVELLGCPPEEFLKQASRASRFFKGEPPDAAQPRYCTSSDIAGGHSSQHHWRGPPGSRRLDLALGLVTDTDQSHAVILDFFARLLRWSPSERPTPREALHHPWLVWKEDSTGLQKIAESTSADAYLHDATGGLPKRCLSV